MKRIIAFSALTALALVSAMTAQGPDITTWVKSFGGKPKLAVIDFRGAGSQDFMAAFNSTLFNDLKSSGLFELVPKGMLPLNNPQRPEDFRPVDGNGLALADWAKPAASASHLAFGYTAAAGGALALYGYLDDVRQQNPQSAQLFGKRYAGSLDNAGAIKVAHEYANDIITQFGGTGSLLGSRIYFVSNRGSAKGNWEIWVMDWDGNNAKQLTKLGALTSMPNISPDGTKLAFTTWAYGQPRIELISTTTGRRLNFYNQEASLNANVSFTPDGKQIYYSSTANESLPQIYVANADGGGFKRVSHRNAIEVEPKVNPKNPGQLLIVSGPGHQQIYSMTSEGLNVERVTNGEGEASNPSWHPDGQHFAFAWTRGYATGNFNIFVMDIGTKQYVQLTHSEGRNENPTWAPDGRHIVFTSNRSGRPQIYSMLADGTEVRQLTNQGDNKFPVWGVQ